MTHRRALHLRIAAAALASGVFAWHKLGQFPPDTKRGWITRLRRDVSGIGKVESAGDRATIETARGTRYPFRRRENGIWGLSMFTAELVAEAERAARDWDVVEKAALDYERGR